MQLNLLIKPVAEVAVGEQLIHLFPPSINLVGDYCSIPDELTAEEKLRKLLPFIASLQVPQSIRDDREPLPDELVTALSNAELEQIAGIYVGIPAFDKVRSGNGELAPLVQGVGEFATSFLDRIFKAEAGRQRRIFDRLNSPS